MKKLITLFTIATVIVFVSCKKNIDPVSSDISTDDKTVSQVQTQDSKNIDENINEAINTMNDYMGGAAGARMEAQCGYTVSTLAGSQFKKGFIFTFDNTACTGRKRAGTITVELITGDSYLNAGSQWQVTYSGYAVTKLEKTISINGVHTVTNVSGGMAGSVLYGETIVTHSVRGNMTIKFDTTQQTRTWTVARKTTWANSAGVLSMTIEGDTTADGYSKLFIWGENRFGDKFYTQLPTAYSINTTCGIFRPVSGGRIHSLYLNNQKYLITTETLVDSDHDGCSDTYQLSIDKNGTVKSYSFSF